MRLFQIFTTSAPVKSSVDGCSLQGSWNTLNMQRKETRQMLWDGNTSEFSSQDDREGYQG